MFNHKSCDLVALILSAKIPFKLSCIPEVISHITAHIHQGNPFMMYVYINNHIYCKYLTILFANYTSVKLKKYFEASLWSLICIYSQYMDHIVKLLSNKNQQKLPSLKLESRSPQLQLKVIAHRILAAKKYLFCFC